MWARVTRCRLMRFGWVVLAKLFDGAVGLVRGERAGLIPTHQPAVAGNIRAQDCGEPAFNALPHHGSLSRIVWVVGDSLGIAANRV